jgi:hypothetical protein
LLGNFSTPNYPALYLVGSAELEEVKQKGAAIDGVVGSVIPVTYREEYKDHFTGRVRRSLSHENQVGQILFAECSPFKITSGKPYRGPKPLRLSSCLWWGFMVLLGVIPYGVIGGLTHFQAAQSTQSQRVLTMFWLASGVFIEATIPFISFSFREILDIIKEAFSQKARKNADEAKGNAAKAKEKEEKAVQKANEAKDKVKEARTKYRDATEAAEDAGEQAHLAGVKAQYHRRQLEEDYLRRKFAVNGEEHEWSGKKDMQPQQSNWRGMGDSGMGRLAIWQPLSKVEHMRRDQLFHMDEQKDENEHNVMEWEIKKNRAENFQKLKALEKAEDEELQQATVIAEARAAEEFKASREAATRAEIESKAKRYKAKVEEDRAKAAVVFLGSLVFCAGAISGFVVVGQMLTDYGSCILLS